MDLQDKKHTLCKEAILFSNTELNHFEIFFRSGQHKMTFNNVGQDAITEENFGGIQAFYFCEDIKNEFESIAATVEAFVTFTAEGMPRITPEPKLWTTSLQDGVRNFVNITMEWDMV